MHEAAGMHLISTCTGNEVGSSYVLAFGSWITFVSCNALGVTLHIGIGDRTMDNGKQLIILVMMIIDYYQRLKDPYSKYTAYHLIIGLVSTASNMRNPTAYARTLFSKATAYYYLIPTNYFYLE